MSTQGIKSVGYGLNWFSGPSAVPKTKFGRMYFVPYSPGLSIEQALKILKTYAGNNKAGERKKRGRKRDKKDKKKVGK